VLRELVEVVVERVGAGDEDPEGSVRVRTVDDREDAVDVTVVGDVDRDQQGVPVA
jgi:hypothetical protein